MFCCGFVHTICYLRGFVLLLWIRPHNFLFERIRPLVMDSSIFCFVDSSTRILFLRGFVLLLWIRPFLVCGFVHFYVPFCLALKEAFCVDKLSERPSLPHFKLLLMTGHITLFCSISVPSVSACVTFYFTDTLCPPSGHYVCAILQLKQLM